MRFSVKVVGINLPAKDLDKSYLAIKTALDLNGILYGAFRYEGATIFPPTEIDFSVSDVVKLENCLQFNVMILKPTLEIDPAEMYITPSYLVDVNRNKVLNGLYMTPKRK